jgi:hypothetical protein
MKATPFKKKHCVQPLKNKERLHATGRFSGLDLENWESAL